jgi:hypothetical protein
MLLLVESTDDRINYDRGLITHKKRTFAALKSDGKNRRDLLVRVRRGSEVHILMKSAFIYSLVEYTS